jgi:hypothetical protein
MPMKDRDWYVDPLRDDPDTRATEPPRSPRPPQTAQSHAAWLREQHAMMERIARDSQRAARERRSTRWAVGLALLLLALLVVAALLLSGAVVITPPH